MPVNARSKGAIGGECKQTNRQTAKQTMKQAKPQNVEQVSGNEEWQTTDLQNGRGACSVCSPCLSFLHAGAQLLVVLLQRLLCRGGLPTQQQSQQGRKQGRSTTIIGSKCRYAREMTTKMTSPGRALAHVVHSTHPCLRCVREVAPAAAKATKQRGRRRRRWRRRRRGEGKGKDKQRHSSGQWFAQETRMFKVGQNSSAEKGSREALTHADKPFDGSVFVPVHVCL